jgi:SAM-dependent methyltransferase
LSRFEDENITIFDLHAKDYDYWFDRHPAIFESELSAISKILPVGRGLEIGAGTGRFAHRLGIKTVVEPSKEMAAFALKRGLEVISAKAEKLPFPDNEFDFALFVTVLCFLKSPEDALREAIRIVKPSGKVIVALIDLNTELGRAKEGDPFFKTAKLLSASEARAMMRRSGLKDIFTVQTLFGSLDKIVEPQIPKEGDGDGGFVVISGQKEGL